MPPPGCPMVRILTAHRVFPAKVTGGNGIAGTSVVPGYCLNNTLKAAGAAMTFLLQIKLYKTMGLSWFRQRYDGRPRPFPDGARAIRREACGFGSIPESQLLRRRVRPSSKEHSSLLPLRVLISFFLRLRCAWRVGCGEVLMCCWLVNGGFAVVAGRGTPFCWGVGCFFV